MSADYAGQYNSIKSEAHSKTSFSHLPQAPLDYSITSTIPLNMLPIKIICHHICLDEFVRVKVDTAETWSGSHRTGSSQRWGEWAWGISLKRGLQPQLVKWDYLSLRVSRNRAPTQKWRFTLMNEVKYWIKLHLAPRQWIFHLGRCWWDAWMRC